MLTGVWQLGKIKEHEKIKALSTFEDELFQDVTNNDKYKHLIKIVFGKESSEEYTYKGLDYEEISKSKFDKYAYIKGSSNGPDFSPTSRFTGIKDKNGEKVISTLDKKLLKSIKNLTELKKVNEKFKNEQDMLISVGESFQKEFENIKQELIEMVNSIDSKKKDDIVITVVFKQGEKSLYPGDIKLIVHNMRSMVAKKYYEKHDKISKGEGVCHYCNSYAEVFGFVNTYNFYTVDKIGMVSGGFEQKNAYKNYPVCNGCASILDDGKSLLTRYFASRFCGFSYLVIPKLTLNIPENMIEVFEIFRDYESLGFSTENSKVNSLMTSEKDYLEIMKESNNNMNYNIMIYEEDKNSFKINVLIEDVVPSKIKRLIRVKTEVENQKVFKNVYKDKKDKVYKGVNFTFANIRAFFPNNKMDGNFNKSFLEVISKIFTNSPINYNFLLDRIMKMVRKSFANKVDLKYKSYTTLIYYGLSCLNYLDKLELLIDKPKGECLKMVDKKASNIMYLEFMEENKESFDSDYKKGVFLTGVLVGKLLAIQYSERNAQPFYSRLNGLKLDLKLIQRIYTESINKFNEYGKNYYRELESMIAEYLLIGDPKESTNDEISFYFTLGLTLAKKFKTEREVTKNDEK